MAPGKLSTGTLTKWSLKAGKYLTNCLKLSGLPTRLEEPVTNYERQDSVCITISRKVTTKAQATGSAIPQGPLRECGVGKAVSLKAVP